MKKFLSKMSLLPVFALVVLLGGCGGGGLTGGYDSLPVQGTISGLGFDGLVLLNNGGDAISPAATASGSATFSFPQQVKIGNNYTVSIASQPKHQTCTISNPTDQAGRTVSITVVITCTVNSYTIGGTVTGLTGQDLRLTNGSDNVFVPPSTIVGSKTTYVFPTAVPYSFAYGVAVWADPAGQHCTVVNGTATMGDAPVSNIDVTCVPTQ